MFAHVLRTALLRAALVAASFFTTAAVMLAVGAAFDHVSREPFLRDTPQAREAVSRCDALGRGDARQRCVSLLIAQAQARDAGATQLATLGKAQRDGR